MLFSAPMVRAILAGTKTQTRRVVKPQPVNCKVSGCDGKHWIWKGHHTSLNALICHNGLMLKQCPYGHPGERIWVKETWATSIYCDDRPPSDMEKPGRGYGWSVWYAADDWLNPRGRPTVEGGPGFTTKGKTRVSIHMPRWASRINLEIVSVRVERLQEISEEDAIAEGCPMGADGFPIEQPHESGIGMVGWDNAIEWYSDLWEQINGEGSWELNPFVWVVEFKRI